MSWDDEHTLIISDVVDSYQLAGKTSIEAIKLCGLDIYGSRSYMLDQMLPFVRVNANLSKFTVLNCSNFSTGWVSQLALVIESCRKSLKHMEIYGSPVMDESFPSLLTALESHPQLEQLDLSAMCIGVNKSIALSSFLQKSAPNLLKLTLYCNELDDVCVDILVDAVQNMGSLKVLDLSNNSHANTTNGRRSGITSRGWRNLAALLSGKKCNLEEMILEENEMFDDDALLVVASSIAPNSKLKKLALSRGKSITIEGWCDFSTVIRDNHQLEELWLVSCRNVDGRCANAALSTLSPSPDTDQFKLVLSHVRISPYGDHVETDLMNDFHSDRLRVLKLSYSHATERGWTSLANLLKTSCTSLEKLELRSCNINDKSLDALVDTVQGSRLVCLNLSDNNDVSTRGWHSIVRLLTSSNLEEIDLCHNSIISDKEARVYAESLRNNNKLTALTLSNTSITEAGWSSFFNIMCDSTSINNTFLSNHTLCNLGENTGIKLERIAALNGISTYDMDDDSSDSSQFQFKDNSNADIAIMKILNFHQHFDMTPLFEWGYKVLPVVIDWFKRARSIETNVRAEDYIWWEDEDDYESSTGSDDEPATEDRGIRYVIPTMDFCQEYEARVDKGELDTIYQFVRAM
ncbi:hypothetical protein ACHAWF_004890, partial [Thalassiosira exigua]